MICPFCGAEIIDTAKFCTECGAPVKVPQAPVVPAAPVIPEPQPIKPAEPQPEPIPQPETSPEQPHASYAEAKPDAPIQPSFNAQPDAAAQGVHPMKWYKFLTCFALFFAAFCYAISALRLFCGTQYGAQRDAVYSLIPGLRVLDILYGLVFLVLAALCIYARFQLAKFRKNGPSVFLLIYVISIVAGIVYMIVGSVMLSRFNVSFGDLIDSSTVSSFITSALMIVLNKIYFDKRKDLFVN